MSGLRKSEAKTEIGKDSPCLYKLEKNESFGRHFVASQDIPAGTLIIKENPVIVEPIDPNGNFNPLNNCIFSPIAFSCLSCCREMSNKLICTQCRLPICSPKCSELTNHRDFECKIFKGATLRNPQSIPPMVLYQAISILRGMMIKRNNPDLWSKIDNLQSVHKPANKTELQSMHEVVCEAVNYNFRIFKNCFAFRNKRVKFVRNVKDWKKIREIMNINGFSVNFNFDDHINKTRVRNLYKESSMLAHGCFPNCSWSFGPAPNFAIEIWSAVDISQGEPLTIMYSKNATLVGSLERQTLTLQSNSKLDFFCFCSRCVDPTELGTMFSAVKCECLASNGFLLSSNPRKFYADWVCQNDECKIVKSLKEIRGLINVHKGKIRSIHYNDLKPEFVEQLKAELLEKFGANHWLNLTLSRTIIQLIEKRRKKNPDDVYIPELYISMARNVDRMYDMIMPGFQLEKSVVKMKLYKALLTKYQKDVAKNTKKENFHDQLLEIYKVQKEIWELYRRDPSYRENIAKFVTDLEKLKVEIESKQKVVDDQTAPKLEKLKVEIELKQKVVDDQTSARLEKLKVEIELKQKVVDDQTAAKLEKLKVEIELKQKFLEDQAAAKKLEEK